MDVSPNKSRIIFDPLYGFIHLTQVEWEIIHSPFYQRLRWIKQLGFTCYVFPGAEHSRFGHSIGVLYNAHKILESCQRAVSNADLFDVKVLSKEALYHKSIRLAALMHDLGTFPFSHTTEAAYISFAETASQKDGKQRHDDHEHLGSFIIKNTEQEGGITYILKKYGFDPQKISDLVKGVDPSIMANQILHSEIDCDRMDYLLRDAHYTGLKYGAYDRDYLLHHFRPVRVGAHDILTIKHNALHCVEDFLMARFAWYSQVIRSGRGARFDAIAEDLTFYLLEKEKIFRYSDLLDMIKNDPKEFYKFNDVYFMGVVHELYISGQLDKNPKMKDLAEIILFERAPKIVKLEEFQQSLLNQDNERNNEKIRNKALTRIQEIQECLSKKGGPADWIVPDLPKKDVFFVKSYKQVVKSMDRQNVLLSRDPAKISYDSGEVKLLAEVENSVISRLQDTFNYLPNLYCSDSAMELLKREKLLE